MNFKLHILVAAVFGLVAGPAVAAESGTHTDLHRLRFGKLIHRFVPFRGQSPAAAQANVKNWFDRYDQIRRQAQMTEGERAESDRLQDKGVFVLLSGSDKEKGRSLLTTMVSRYSRAAEQMDGLPKLTETQRLRHGYARYFRNARSLFQDYLTVYNNIFAKDSNGESLRKKLKERKSALEALDASNKSLDERLRARYRIAAFQNGA